MPVSCWSLFRRRGLSSVAKGRCWLTAGRFRACHGRLQLASQLTAWRHLHGSSFPVCLLHVTCRGSSFLISVYHMISFVIAPASLSAYYMMLFLQPLASLCLLYDVIPQPRLPVSLLHDFIYRSLSFPLSLLWLLWNDRWVLDSVSITATLFLSVDWVKFPAWSEALLFDELCLRSHSMTASLLSDSTVVL